MGSTVTKTNYLIAEVRTQIGQSYDQWFVGTSEWGDMWRKTKADMIVFNVYDSAATRAAFDHFVNSGMRGRRPIGTEPNYLYLYCADGTLPNGFVY